MTWAGGLPALWSGFGVVLVFVLSFPVCLPGGQVSLGTGRQGLSVRVATLHVCPPDSFLLGYKTGLRARLVTAAPERLSQDPSRPAFG